MKFLGRVFLFFISLGFLGAIAGVIFIGAVVYKYGQDLPDFANLKDYKPAVVTRVHAGDGRFLAEFSQEKRIFIPIGEIPDRVKYAFLSAEDQNFYDHKGIDPTAVARAVLINLKNRGQNRRPMGASTITQQVAKNFLLTNHVSYERKIREAIIAYKIEQTLTKDSILELYLNQIFLGARSYGVAAAALNYFNKPLNELNIAECAFLAALPKAPNNYDPVTHHNEAVARRNWVIDRMLIDGHITDAETDDAKNIPLVTVAPKDDDVVNAPYYAEEVRRELQKTYGDDGLYRGGLSVRTSLDPRLQIIAEKALRNGLMSFDRRKGWRGPVAHLDTTSGYPQILITITPPAVMLSTWNIAMVLEAGASHAQIGLADGTHVTLAKDDVSWAAASSKPLKAGDVVMIELVTTEKPDTSKKDNKDTKDDKALPTIKVSEYRLRQIPLVQGAFVALDPNNGRILAMQGGWKSDGSEFNRATQAKRQPGSAFKPFIYLAALDQGYTPSSIVLDSPMTFTDQTGKVWQPENYHNDFMGPTPLRVGIEKSRNLMTIRLSQQIGMNTVVEYAKRFGITDKMQPYLSNALGASETTLMQLTAAYGMIVNGGKQITPSFIDRVQDRHGATVERSDKRECLGCGPLIKWEKQTTPTPPDNRVPIADPRTAYQMVSILEGVVQRGTARALADLDRPIAGKTGTTNDSKDVWFVGFTPDLVAGVFVGYDDPKTLGKKETGASISVPIFKEFMAEALKDIPPTPFRVPAGVRMVQVNAKNGRPTSSDDADAIWEPFLAGTEPNNSSAIVMGDDNGDDSMTTQPLPAEEMLQPNPDDSGNFNDTGQGTGGVY